MLTKNTFVEEIRKQYVLVARAKGLSQRRVLYKHVFRNALIPLVTGFPAAFIGAFFAGSVLIETLFSLDGLGLLGYESVDPPRLSGRARLALPVHADRAGRQAGLRPAVHGRRPAGAVRERRPMSSRDSQAAVRRSSRRAAPAAVDALPALAAPARRGCAVPAQPASGCSSLWIFLLLLVVATGGRAVQQRPADRRAASTAQLVCADVQQPEREAARRRLRDADRLEGSADRRASWPSPATGRCITLNPHSADSLDYFNPALDPAPPERRATGSAPMRRAATCSRGCSTAFASASGSRWR